MPVTIFLTCKACERNADFTAEDDPGAWDAAERNGWRRNVTIDDSTWRKRELVFPTCPACSRLVRELKHV